MTSKQIVWIYLMVLVLFDSYKFYNNKLSLVLELNIVIATNYKATNEGKNTIIWRTTFSYKYDFELWYMIYEIWLKMLIYNHWWLLFGLEKLGCSLISKVTHSLLFVIQKLSNHKGFYTYLLTNTLYNHLKGMTLVETSITQWTKHNCTTNALVVIRHEVLVTILRRFVDI